MFASAGARNYAMLLGGVCVLLLLSYELSARNACTTSLTLAEQVSYSSEDLLLILFCFEFFSDWVMLCMKINCVVLR